MALVAAVGPPGEGWTGTVAGGADAARTALTEAEVLVAAVVGAWHGAPSTTRATIVPCGAAVLTEVPGDTWRTGARPAHSITGASILALAHLLAP